MRLGAPLKWAGGKRWLLPVLEQLYSPYRKARLVEPFLGGMSVTLGLLPKRALLSDVNPHSINFFLCLKRGLHISAPMRNDRRFYNRMRLKFNRMIEHGRAKGDEAAALFYYLNRTGFNGLCRFNSSGQFNVPFGKYSNIGYRDDFEAYQ